MTRAHQRLSFLVVSMSFGWTLVIGKLCGFVPWTWPIVTAPIWIPVGILLHLFLLALIADGQPGGWADRLLERLLPD